MIVANTIFPKKGGVNHIFLGGWGGLEFLEFLQYTRKFELLHIKREAGSER